MKKALDLVLYWRSISRRKWSILGLASVITVLAAVTAFMMTPIYRSTVTLMIEQNKAKVVSVEDIYSGIGSSPRVLPDPGGNPEIPGPGLKGGRQT